MSVWLIDTLASSLHLNFQYGQRWHLSTQLRNGERTGRRLLWSTTLVLPTIISDSQVSISLVIHGLRWTVSGQAKVHVVLTCTNGVSPNHLPVILASDRPWTTLSTRADWPLTKFEGGLNLLHEADDEAVIWLECIQRLQHSRNNTLYTGWNDVTESMVTIRPPCCGYNLAWWVELKGEDLWSYSHKIESVSLRKCPYDH